MFRRHGIGSERLQELAPNGHHVSRQNTNTGRLTAAMFDAVLAAATALAFAEAAV